MDRHKEKKIKNFGETPSDRKNLKGQDTGQTKWMNSFIG